jgi:hypothetical protein
VAPHLWIRPRVFRCFRFLKTQDTLKELFLSYEIRAIEIEGSELLLEHHISNENLSGYSLEICEFLFKERIGTLEQKKGLMKNPRIQYNITKVPHISLEQIPYESEEVRNIMEAVLVFQEQYNNAVVYELLIYQFYARLGPHLMKITNDFHHRDLVGNVNAGALIWFSINLYTELRSFDISTRLGVPLATKRSEQKTKLVSFQILEKLGEVYLNVKKEYGKNRDG